MNGTNLCIILNPHAGRGRAAAYLERIRREGGDRIMIRPTTGPGHAEELAREAAQDGFAVVAAAGGDGTVHEVVNGLLQAGRPDVIFRVLPIGSANDYAQCLRDNHREPSAAPASPVRTVDVGQVQDERGRQRFFVNGLGLGFNGAVTREARRIRYLRGLPLYTLALLRTLWYHYHCPLLTLTFDGQLRKQATLALTVNLGQREGNFRLTPDARLDDGWFDYLHAGALGRLELLRYVPAMITGRLPKDNPRIRRDRCQHVLVEAVEPLTVHLDGEFFCQPADRVRRLEVRLLPRRLSVWAAV